MKKKSLYLSLASLVLILVSLTMLGVTYGWFAGIFDLNSGTISVGDLRYSETGAFISGVPEQVIVIQPDLELIATDITVTNESSINSHLRVKIEYTRMSDYIGPSTIVAYSNALDDHLSVTFGSTFAYASDYWYYSATDATILANSGLMSLITSLYYDADVTGNDYSEVSVVVTVTIEVKQDDNVTWAELSTYDFSTGYPA